MQISELLSIRRKTKSSLDDFKNEKKNEKSLTHLWDYKKKNLTFTSSMSQEGQEK